MLKRVYANPQTNTEPPKIVDMGSSQVIIDSSYLDSVANIEVSVNQSNFSRVSPMTASTDLTAVTQMISSFLIGP